MSKKRHSNECPTCEKIPCQCASAGGGAANEEKSEKDENKRNESAVDHTVNRDKGAHMTLFDENNQLLCCTLFSSTENQSSNHLDLQESQEDSASNVANTSSTKGMKMGGTDE